MMNQRPRTPASDAPSSDPERGGPVPADDLSADDLREAEQLGDGSPAVEPRQPEDE